MVQTAAYLNAFLGMDRLKAINKTSGGIGKKMTPQMQAETTQAYHKAYLPSAKPNRIISLKIA